MVKGSESSQVRADTVELSTHEMFWVYRTYKRRLRGAGFSPERDPELWREMCTQAEAAIVNCFVSVRATSISGTVANLKGATVVDAEAMSENFSPADFIRATAILSDVILDSFTEMFRAHPDGVRVLSSVVRTLNRGIFIRSQAVLAANEVDLLDRARRVQVADRRRLSRDIHDWVGNAISLADRNLELYEILEERGLPGGEERFALARQAVGEVLEGTRRIVSDLRMRVPMGSFGDALRTFARSAAPEGVTLHIDLRGDEAQLPADVRDDLFVLVREFLRNSFRHAGADYVRVFVGISAHAVVAVVEDDGAGFDVVAARESERGHGLDSASERVDLLGGRLFVRSTPGEGTRVEIDVPLTVAQVQVAS